MTGRTTPFPLQLDEERTPLLGPISACGPSSKILSEVSGTLKRLQPHERSLQKTKVYPLIHLIRVDVLTHIGERHAVSGAMSGCQRPC